MPLYFMSVFEIPKWVIKEIDKIRMKFFWHGNQDTARRLTMVPWTTICMPKKQGGLGVLNLSDMNKALLAKWIWHWTNSKNGPWPLLAAKLQNNEFTPFPENSPLVHAFKEIAPIMQVNLVAHPSDGNDILFWEHNWGPGTLKYKCPDLYSFAKDKGITLAGFTAKWRGNQEIFQSSLHSSHSAINQWQSLVPLLHNLILVRQGIRDNFRWRLSMNGMFSVKSFYNFLKGYPKVDTELKNIWVLNIPPRMKIFIWQMAINKIATVDNLKKRGWQLPNICYMCYKEEETVSHLFNECRYFEATIEQLKAHSIFLRSNNTTSIPDFLLNISVEKTQKELVAILCFVIWRERCSRIFRGKRCCQDLLVDQTIFEWEALNKSSNN